MDYFSDDVPPLELLRQEQERLQGLELEVTIDNSATGVENVVKVCSEIFSNVSLMHFTSLHFFFFHFQIYSLLLFIYSRFIPFFFLFVPDYPTVNLFFVYRYEIIFFNTLLPLN